MAEPPENSVQPTDPVAWRAWLETNHDRDEGVWLVTYKKASGKPRMTYDEAVDEAICFGWVDSKPAKLDDERSMRWFAPRQPGSGWSRVNKDRVARMQARGKMATAGLAKVEGARADGSWTALDGVENLEIPPDLDDAFAEYEHARENFEAFPRSVKRGILEWIQNAKREATRAKRVEETARLADENIRANQWRPPKTETR